MPSFPPVGGYPPSTSGSGGTALTADQIKSKLESLVQGNRLSAEFLDPTADRQFLTPTQAQKLTNAVELGSDGKLPALDGSKLTNIPGTIPFDPSDIVDPSIQQGQIPIWDDVQQKFVPAGISADDGELTVSPDSVVFGNHKMSSSVGNVVFTNADTGKKYYPIWQEATPTGDKAWLREHAPTEEVVRVTGTDDVTNPRNSGIMIDKDESFFGGTFTLTDPANDVVLELTDSKGHIVWRDKLGDLIAGEHTVIFDTPIDLRKGTTYNAILSSQVGDLVAKGSNGKFAWKIKRAAWSDIELASKKWVLAQKGSGGTVQQDPKTIVSVTEGSNQLTFHHLDGTTTALPMATPGGQTSGNPKAIVSVQRQGGGNVIYRHADGTTTAIKDVSGASTKRVGLVEADVTQLKKDVTALKTQQPLNTPGLNQLKTEVTTIEQEHTQTAQALHTLTQRVDAIEKAPKPAKPDVKTTPEFYGGFGDNWPTSLQGYVPSVGKQVTITRTTSGASRVFILVPLAHASAVTGIKEKGGIASLWQSSDTTIDGKGYRRFVSPKGIYETTATYIVEFGQERGYV